MRLASWIIPACIAGLVSFATTVRSAPAGDETSPAAVQPALDSVTMIVPVWREQVDWEALNLARAVDLWLRGDVRGAAGLLETIDVSSASSFADADRAAFLLAAAYLQLNDGEAFRDAAERAAGTSSPYRRWIRYCQLVRASGEAPNATIPPVDPPSDLPGAELIAAAMLLEMQRAPEAIALLERIDPRGSLASIHLYLRALAITAAGGDATRDWQKLASRKASNHLEADLVASALVRLAVARMERGDDPSDLLERVPAESRHTPRAWHMLALQAIERGDREEARALLARILTEHPIYEGRRDVMLALGGLAMDAGDWDGALPYFESAEGEWLYEHESLAYFENDDALATVWSAWDQRVLWRDEIRLAPEAVFATMVRFADASLDLRRRPNLDTDDDLMKRLWPSEDRNRVRAAWDRTDALARHYPRPDELDALRRLQRERRHATSVLARHERSIVDHERNVARRLHYFGRGRDRTSESIDTLARATARLDTILAAVDAALADLIAARDGALLDIATRTRKMLEGIEREQLFMRALRHFHVDGPRGERPEQFPADVPSPAHLLEMEMQLASAVDSFVTLFAQHYPAVIDRSYAEIWEPRIAGDSRRLHAALLAELRRARRIGGAIDSTVAWYESDPTLAAAVARRRALAATVDSLAASERELQRQIAHAVAARGREQLASEREALDYHLADASYEIAVRTATDPATAEVDSLVEPQRERAIARLQKFLERYPNSIARGESRFRLADLQLMQARADFQVTMAEFLGQDPTADDLGNRALAPFVNYAPAIALYESILNEDPDFPHVDAVLFNLGMILSDDGQARGTDYLRRLVQSYPDSPDCQEAYLRMGSDHFDRKEFAACIPYLEQAIAGDDPSFAAIALYKLGWARFEQDHFDASADAFRRLMDLYDSHEDLAEAMDLRDEAEEYLVHSLARSGGADAFRLYFDSIGGRDYESRVLMSLGHLMRSISLYEEAVECDELWLSRHPLHAKVPAVAERLVDTYKSWNKPELARAAKLAHAERFLPGSPWFEANTDAELRAKGVQFAQSAYRETAAYYHRDARETGSAESWHRALTNYERYLTYWPQGHDADRMHFVAGEAANRLQRFSHSLDHFAAAATSDSTALAMDAAWQRVAVSDTWYRRTATSEQGNGADSLAANLLVVGDEFIDRFPSDDRAADIMWRQGNVAYAHGWDQRAAASFTRLAELFPADPRANYAVRMSGDAHYRHKEYEAAGAAYERALVLARTAGQDSVAAELALAIPLCYYKHAESVAAADSVHGDREAAHLFARVAREWPQYEHAHLALYRAGLGFAARKDYANATAAWEELLARHPMSEYARDSAIQVALAHEKSGDATRAARAYQRFSERYPDDPDAPDALLKAVDLLADAKDQAGAEAMRTAFLERYPGETETVMEIRAARAERELADVVGGTTTLAALLAAPGGAVGTSNLQAYLALAEANPELASPAILAPVDYYKAEEAYPAYVSMRLTQPLPEAIEAKKAKMEDLLKLYDKCAAHGIAEYARASAHRIGRVLIDFGDALIASERPKELNDDELLAYEEVIEEQAWQFYDRGENVWSELLQQVRDAEDDPGRWIARTREALWPRLGQRFLYRPEVEYPLVSAVPPARPKAE